jgi:chitodextrinase
VTRLNPLGTKMVFSTYLGGFSQDFATGAAIDPAGEVYVTGYTLSSGFPLAFPLQSTLRGTVDAFVVRISEGAAPPVFPTGLTTESICNTSILLRWTDNSDDEDAFEIERKSGSGQFVPIAAVPTDVAVYEDSGLSPNTGYVYRVRATNQDGASTYSNELMVTTLLATVTAPSDLSVTVVSHNSLRLTWQDNSGDEAGFRIERSTNAAGPFSLVATVAANLEEFTDTGLTPETAYSYRVRAASGGCDSQPTPISSAETLSEPVAGPTGLVGLAISESQVSLTWVDQSANETGFRIERKSGEEFVERAQVGPDVVTFTDTGLAPTTAYTYRVRAVNGEGLSAPSNEVRVTTTALPRGVLKVPKTVNFGTVRLGQTKTMKLVIRNGSRAEQMRLTIGNVVPPFTTTGSGIHTVLIGGNRTLTVTFKPTGPGKASTKLEVLSSDPRKPRAEITFTGKGK